MGESQVTSLAHHATFHAVAAQFLEAFDDPAGDAFPHYNVFDTWLNEPEQQALHHAFRAALGEGRDLIERRLQEFLEVLTREWNARRRPKPPPDEPDAEPDAYFKGLWDTIQRMVAEGVPNSAISEYVSMVLQRDLGWNTQEIDSFLRSLNDDEAAGRPLIEP